MTETAEPASRPIETELKYRVSDVDAAARYLTAADRRAVQRQRVDAVHADGGSLRRHGRRRLPPRRLRGPPPDHRHRHDRLGEVARQAERRRWRHAARGDRGPRRSRARPVRMAGVRRPLAGARAGRRRAARRGRHRAADAAPATAPRPRDARRAEPRRRRRRGPRPGRRPLRGARGGAAPGERGAARRPGGIASTAIRPSPDRRAASSRPRSPRSHGTSTACQAPSGRGRRTGRGGRARRCRGAEARPRPKGRRAERPSRGRGGRGRRAAHAGGVADARRGAGRSEPAPKRAVRR